MRHHFIDRGTGEAVVFIHGTVPEPTAFDAVADAFVGQRRVLAPKLPGHGESAWEGPYSLAERADAIAEDLRELGARRCALVGYSLGGYIALALASRVDLEVTHVVTLGGFAMLHAGARDRLRGFASLIHEGRFGEDVLRAGAASFYAPEFASRRPDCIEATMASLRALAPEVIAAECLAAADADDLRPRLRDVRARVVARSGELDAAVPPIHAHDIVAAVAHGEVQIVGGAGHALLDEDIDGTRRAIVDALARTA